MGLRAALEGQVQDWSAEQRALVFPNKAGRIMQYSSFLEDVWQPLLAKAGLPYRKYHSTRHTFATWLLSDGADLRWVQQQLGHASIAQTADTYGHVQPDRHEAAVNALDQYLLAREWPKGRPTEARCRVSSDRPCEAGPAPKRNPAQPSARVAV